MTQPSNPVPVPPVAEPGVTTSEYKVAIFTGIHDALVILVAVGLNAFGLHPDDTVKQLIGVEVGAVSTIATAYIVSRGIRKTGTQG